MPHSTHRRIALVATLLVAAAGRSAAADQTLLEDWRWVRFSTADGLPSDDVIEVIETSEDEPWAATAGGIARFDGYRWHEVGDDTGASLGDVRDITMDGDDRVWAVTATRVLRGDVRGLRTVHTFAPEETPVSIATDGDGDVFVLTRARARPKQTRLLRVDDSGVRSAETPAGLEAHALTSMGDAPGAVWVTGGGQNFRRASDGWERRFGSADVVDVLAVSESADGWGVGALRYPPELSGVWEWAPRAEPVRTRVPGLGSVRALAAGRAGRALVLLDDGRVYHHGSRAGGRPVDGAGWTEIRDPPSAIASASRLSYRANGDLWVGTRRGLWLHRSALAGWRRLPPSHSPLGDRVHELVPAVGGGVWAATGDGVEFRDASGERRSLPPLPAVRDPTVTGLAVHPDGSLWASSGGAFTGVRRWDGASWQIVDRDTAGAPIGMVHKIRRDAAGTLWLLSLTAELERPFESGGAVHTVRGNAIERWDDGGVFRDQRVYDTAEAGDGARWFLASDIVLRWTPESTTAFRSVTLTSARGYGLAVDAHGAAWVGRRGGGLLRITPDGRAVAEPVPREYESVPIWDLRFDAEGRLWMATDGGLLCRHGESWTVMDDTTGLGAERLWPVAFTDRGVLVGSRGRGIWQLDWPALVEPPPSVELRGVVVDDDQLHAYWHAAAWWAGGAARSAETRTRVDTEPWRPWSRSTTLDVAGLSAGRHTIEVEVRGPFGVEGARRVHTFQVEAPTFRRPQVVVPIALLCAAVLVVLALHLRRRRRDAETIRRNEATYRGLLDEAFDAIVVCATDGSIVEANERFAALVGATHAELQGGPIQAWLAPADDLGNAFPWPTLEQGPVLRRCRPRQSRGGTGTELETALQPLSSGRVLLVMRDLTNRLDMERRLVENLDAEQQLRARAQDSEAQLHRLAARLANVQEDERAQLARELHDQLGQELTGVKLLLEAHRANGDDLPADALRDASSLVTGMLNRVRELSWRLRPLVLDDLGLVPALLRNVEQVDSQSSFAVEFRHEGVRGRLAARVETAVYRIVQEALTNASRHADAANVSIVLRQTDGHVEVLIEDDGRGFDVDDPRSTLGLGVTGMRERAAQLGGTLELTSHPGVGTTVFVRLPVRDDDVVVARGRTR